MLQIFTRVCVGQQLALGKRGVLYANALEGMLHILLQRAAYHAVASQVVFHVAGSGR